MRWIAAIKDWWKNLGKPKTFEVYVQWGGQKHRLGCEVLSAACADAMDPVHTDEKEDFEKQDAERRYREEYKRAHADRIKVGDDGEE